MSLWTRFTSKFMGGQDAAAPREADTDRPGLSPIDMINFGFVQPVLRNAYFFAENCSLLSDIDLTLTQETFRAGISIEPAFVRKCANCGHEMQDKKKVCDSCGSGDLREPDASELRLVEHLDGASFLDRANDACQTLSEVCQQTEHHRNICDNGYILAIRDYLFWQEGDDIPEGKEPGDVQEFFVKEFLALDPRFYEKVFDKTGKPGGRHKLCLNHRKNLYDVHMERCPQCGLKLHEVTGKYYTSTESVVYFVEDEVLHLTKYYPHALYGFPPAFKLRMNIFAYMYIEGRIKSYYEKGRPPGIIAVATSNPQGLDESIRKINAMLAKDPNTLPWLPVDVGMTKGAKAVEYVPFMQDPSESMMKVKDEVRRSICSYFNVSPIFMADTSASGGLNNEGHQITVTNRAIEMSQEGWNTKAFPWIMRQLHVGDWKLELVSSEQNDETAELQQQLLEDQHAKNMMDMGFQVWTDDGKFRFSDKPSEKPMPQLQPSAGAPQSDASSGVSGAPTNKGEDMMPFELVHYTGDEDKDAVIFANALVNKESLLEHASQIIDALFSMSSPAEFVGIGERQAKGIMGTIVESMTQRGGWSVSQVVQRLREKNPSIDEDDLRRIVRTESERIAVKAHEIEAVENDPPEARYQWRGARDRRTCKTHDRIMRTQPKEGLRLNDLKAFVAKAAAEDGLTVQDDWLLHPNQRGSFKRVFGGL